MMTSRRVFPLSVDASSSSTSVNRSQPPPPKSPLHRTPTRNGSVNEVARPPTGGSVGYLGFDRLMIMRQVNAAAAPPTAAQVANGGEEASAAVNHRQRMAAEQQRRLELALMAKEDYIGTPEGQERLQRQEERSLMKEEELLVLRLVEAEKEAARKLQREKELEEEKRIKEQYLAKIRAQREQQEAEAKEKEAARKAEMERKMKALKEAADAKARAEFAERQHAIEEEARIAREKNLIEVENTKMQVEDVVGHAMQQEWIAERDRQQQIAAEQEEWRLFQEREQEKQREATLLRRAAMAQQYEQDKQRRIQIHKLQKERAAQQAERKDVQSRQAQEHQVQKERNAITGNAAPTAAEVEAPTLEGSTESEILSATMISDEPQERRVGNAATALESLNPSNIGTMEADKDKEEIVGCSGDRAEPSVRVERLESKEHEEPAQIIENITVEEIEKPSEAGSGCNKLQNGSDCSKQDVEAPQALDVINKTSTAETNEVLKAPNDTMEGPSSEILSEATQKAGEEVINTESSEVIDGKISTSDELHEAVAVEKEQVRSVWSISAAQQQGLVPFAQILSVTENSPAMQATLKSGDLLVEFGGIVSSTPKCLVAMADCVQKNVNNIVPVVFLRLTETVDYFEELRVSLCPQKWKGKGLLGCQLSPFKWPEEGEPTKTVIEDAVPAVRTDGSNSEEGASALVVYDVVPLSIADDAGLINGDILAGCDGLSTVVSVATLTAVVEHIQSTRASCTPVHLEINRWIPEDQCYRLLQIVLPSADSGPLGFALTSFAEFYNYYTTSDASSSACQECYYTSLTTALHASALNGHVTCLQALLSSLQNGDGGGYSAIDYLDWRDEDGRTPLFYACYAGQLECVRYLVQTTLSAQDEQHQCVSVSADLYGDTVLHAATASGNIAVMAFLLESGCVKVDDRNHMSLTCAHVAPNVETLTFLGEQSKADLLATDAEERMPLAYACLRNDVDSIKYLCKKHPDFVDYADVRGNTPLHVVAWLGLQEAAEVLIYFLPSIALYITNEDGQNAADLARSSGMEGIAAFLDSVIAAADSNVS
ncbi:unnamed protein product [Phytophthora lilii]|uniref:Unnamed protein product n=1 Tax=Phytophthora lilii TaxID=2077276 RepID=A0A9W7CL58_9STRA|nr:unnamed protein product [Phytophthora lilii]